MGRDEISQGQRDDRVTRNLVGVVIGALVGIAIGALFPPVRAAQGIWGWLGYTTVAYAEGATAGGAIGLACGEVVGLVAAVNVPGMWQWIKADLRNRCQMLVRCNDSEKERLRRLVQQKDPGFRFTDHDGSLLSRVNAFVTSTIRYDLRWSGVAPVPEETLRAGTGVCLEFANATCTLINLVHPGRCYVVAGMMANGRAHAWIEYQGAQYEPQQPNRVRIQHSSNGNYKPAFKYNESTFRTLNVELQSKLEVHIQRGMVPLSMAHFAGTWKDKDRTFVVNRNGCVRFTRALRDVRSFRVTDVCLDGDDGLSFTLKFPPDRGNSEGVAFWRLSLDGVVRVRALGRDITMEMAQVADV